MITAASGTDEGLDFAIQWKETEAATDFFESHRIVRALAPGNLFKRVDVLAPWVRLAYTLTGSSTPTFTFSVSLLRRE